MGHATRALMWFRRDLRLADNPALWAAAGAADEVVGIFVVDDELWRTAGSPRRRFLVECLQALDRSMGGQLLIRRGRPEAAIPALAAELGCADVFTTADFGPYGRRRDAAVARALAAAGRGWHALGSPYAVEPGSILRRGDSPYKVFTAFRRAWTEHGWDRPIPRPRGLRWATAASDPLPDAGFTTATLPPAGEEAARRAVRQFWDTHLDDYDSGRDRPGADATSRLSPYLRWGCVHPRQLLTQLSGSPAHRSFATELCWREFYADVLWHDPGSSRRAWNRSLEAMEVDAGPEAEARFAAWAEGRTGYPLVDAGMRQLQSEAWMHNRVRMLVASFLVKDLHLDWRRGALHFLDRLVDGDLASNHHGWQWVAGTGTDAAPYHRVFNPTTQARRFDPDGTYIRRYVPELGELSAGTIHEPWKLADSAPPGYPAPIVDHAEERLEALRRYAACRH